MLVAQLQGWISQVPSLFIPTTILLFIITAVICRYLNRFKTSPLFTQFYLLSMVVKLLTALCYCVLVVLDSRDGAVANVVYFLALYVVYTVIEIMFLYRLITTKSSS
jgi:hypothetical protein